MGKNERWTIFLGLFVIITLFLVANNCFADEDLYNVLGVSQTASVKEIKRAYKNLVKIWHPDKNKEPGASDKFSKIYEAYKILSDSEKRYLYDRHGYAATQEQQHEHNGRGFGEFSGFFRNGPFNGFNFGGESLIDKYTIGLQFYENRILPESYRRPFFLYAYADLCFACMLSEPLIEKLFKKLEDVGIGIGSVHVSSSRALGNRLRINEIPMIMAVVNGKVSYFKGRVSFQTLHDFVRNIFPRDIVQILNDDNLNDFLSGWSDNRVRALFFSARDRPPVRFLLPAFGHREKIATGFVNTKSSSGINAILRKYNINRSNDTLIIVAEESNTSLAIVTMQSLSKGSIEEVMEANQYLMLPRLSSQTFFDDLCPVESHVKHRKFCVILLTKKTPDHDCYRSSFRSYVTQQAPTFQDRVRFTYIYRDTQYQFVDALLNGNSSSEANESSLKLTILWRVDEKQMNYEWVEPGWTKDSELNALTRQNLEKRLQQLFTNTDRLLHMAMLPDFYNEHALGGVMGFLVYLSGRFYDWCDYLFIIASNMGFFTWLFMLMGVAMMMRFGLFSLRHLFGEETEPQNRRGNDSASRQKWARPSSMNSDNSLCIYELSNKSYNYLVKCVEGGLMITLLVDHKLQDKLLDAFTAVVRQYAAYPMWTFGYLLLDKYIGWYQQVLDNSEGMREQSSKLNIQNSIGTVIAINGYRQYYYMFHSKCPQKWTQQVNFGHGEGLFDSGSNSEDESEEMDCLLKGLENWLDKVFDGNNVQKIRVSHWPEMNSPRIPLWFCSKNEVGAWCCSPPCSFTTCLFLGWSGILKSSKKNDTDSEKYSLVMTMHLTKKKKNWQKLLGWVKSFAIFR